MSTFLTDMSDLPAGDYLLDDVAYHRNSLGAFTLVPPKNQYFDRVNENVDPNRKYKRAPLIRIDTVGTVLAKYNSSSRNVPATSQDQRTPRRGNVRVMSIKQLWDTPTVMSRATDSNLEYALFWDDETPTSGSASPPTPRSPSSLLTPTTPTSPALMIATRTSQELTPLALERIFETQSPRPPLSTPTPRHTSHSLRALGLGLPIPLADTAPLRATRTIRTASAPTPARVQIVRDDLTALGMGQGQSPNTRPVSNNVRQRSATMANVTRTALGDGRPALIPTSARALGTVRTASGSVSPPRQRPRPYGQQVGSRRQSLPTPSMAMAALSLDENMPPTIAHTPTPDSASRTSTIASTLPTRRRRSTRSTVPLRGIYRL